MQSKYLIPSYIKGKTHGKWFVVLQSLSGKYELTLLLYTLIWTHMYWTQGDIIIQVV